MQQKNFLELPENDALKNVYHIRHKAQGNKPARQKCCTAGDVDASRAESCLSHEFSQSIADARVERDTQPR